jgi:phage repressor protein C with HTH and peptisase S24 domain
MAMKNRIREIRTDRGISQDALAKMIGRQKALVSKLENGKIKLSQEYLELLSGALACTPAELLGPPAYSKKPLAKRPVAAPPRSAILSRGNVRTYVPVYGPAAAATPDKVFITEDFIVDRKPTPEELIHVRDGFVMFVAGESMYPRYKPGEMVSVHPYRPPSIGHDCVLVFEADGNAIVKEYAGESEDRKEWKLRQYNPEKIIKVKKADVKAIYAVVGRPS